MNKQIRKQTKNKLKSETGASILIALLVFLIAAMTGSVILTSATVSSGAMNRTVKSEQDIDVLKSAANVLVDDLKTPVYLTGPKAKSLNGRLGSVSDLQQYLGQEIMNGNDNKVEYTIDSIQVNDSNDEDIKKTIQNRAVKAEVQMDSQYYISITLYIEGKPGGDKLYVNFNGDPLVPDTETVIRQHDPVISTVKGADDNEETNQ